MNSKKNRLILKNARMVLPHSCVFPGFCVIENGIIANSGKGIPGDSPADEVIDCEGGFLMPGFIDLHNDGLEKEMEPRDRAIFPVEIALFSLESRLVSHGITTIFHSLSLIEGRRGIRSIDNLIAVVNAIKELGPSALIRHCVHARYDLVEYRFAPLLRDMIKEQLIQLLSVMDHTPGQGQYRDVQRFKEYLKSNEGFSPKEADDNISRQMARREDPEIPRQLEELFQLARNMGIPLASHDDDSAKKVESMKNGGITISDFPVCMEAARKAHELGQHVIVGAPNILQGKSNTGNLRAADAIAQGAVDIISSDYFSAGMLHAVFSLYHTATMELEDAVRMVTLNPAAAVGLDHSIGSIEAGKRADLIVVHEIEDIPFVRRVFVDGEQRVARLNSTSRSPQQNLFSYKPKITTGERL